MSTSKVDRDILFACKRCYFWSFEMKLFSKLIFIGLWHNLNWDFKEEKNW